jgi:hypothetical protein
VEFHQLHVDLKTAYVDDPPPFPVPREDVRHQGSHKGYPNAAKEGEERTDGHFGVRLTMSIQLA